MSKEDWTDCLTMEELNFNSDEVGIFNPSNQMKILQSGYQIKIWLTNILFYGIEDLLNKEVIK